MVRERFWTDNPYRLIGGDSSLDSQALRRRATSVSQAARVSLITPIPLADRVETADLTDLPNIVRSIAADHPLRTKFRIMWPMDAAAAALLGTNAIDSGAIASYAKTQIVFLSTWLDFLESPGAMGAEEALRCWHEFACDEISDNRLCELLAAEEHISSESAFDHVCTAQDAIEQHLLDTAIRVAAECWSRGNYAESVGITEAVLESPLNPPSQDASIGPMLRVGDALCLEVEELTSNLPSYEYGNPIDLPKKLVQLERLSSLIAKRNPISKKWAAAVDDWYNEYSRTVWDCALGFHNRSDNKIAVELTDIALGLARDAAFRTHLIEQKRILEENLDYDGIEPIGSTPSMYTLNGIGTRLYSTGNVFAADRRKHFAILYFTIFFVPIFPLTRYLVEDAGSGQWRFFGQTRWTRSMWAHLAISCSLILVSLVGVSLSNAVNTVPASSDAYDASSNVAPQTDKPPIAAVSDVSLAIHNDGKTQVSVDINAGYISAVVAAGADKSWSLPQGTYKVTIGHAGRGPVLSYSLLDPNTFYRLSIDRRLNASLKDGQGKLLTTAKPHRLETISHEKVPQQSNVDYEAWSKQRDAQEHEQEALQRELETLKADLNALDAKIESSSRKVDEERSALLSLKNQIDSSQPDRTNQMEVDNYNSQVEEYESRRRAFNQMVEAHNRIVNEEKRKVKRHNDIVHKLNGK